MKKVASQGPRSAARKNRSKPRAERAENGLRRREAILEAVSFAAEKFVKTVSWEADIQEVIFRLGRAADISRVYILKKEISPEGQVLANIFCEWDAPGIPSQINNPEMKSFDPINKGFGRWLEVFGRGEPVCGRTSDFPQSEQKLLKSMDVKSILAVPIFVQRDLWGLIGFSECRREREWTGAEVEALKAAANILGGAVENEQFRSSLASSERELRALFEAMTDVVLELDKDGRYLKVAPANPRLLYLPADQVIGRRLHDIFPAEQADYFLDSIRQTLQTKKTVELEYSLHVGPQRSLTWFAGTISPMTEDTVVMVARDITARRKAEEALRRSGERFRGLFENMIEGIYQTTPDGQILVANPALLRLLGVSSEEELRAVPAKDFYADPGQRQVWIERMARDGEIRNFESVFKRRDGSLIVVQDNARAIRDADGRILYYEGTLTDITDRKRLEEQLHWLANRDSLTNLFNRRRFNEDLQQQLNQTLRYQQPLALLWLDLDRFKNINDGLGHRAGDELLVEIALLLQDQVRKADILARLGGDEFAILMPHTDAREAETAASRILDAIRERSFRLEEQSVRITASIGIALFPEHGDSADKLLGHADLAMYRAKEQGRDQFSFESSTKLKAEVLEYKQIWSWLADRDFDEQRFLLYAQPVYELAGRSVRQHELLLRWTTDSGLIVSAESFLSLGQKFNLVREIDRWVVRHALRLLGEPASGPQRVLKINLSGRSVIDRELADLFENGRKEINPSALVVGISELSTVSEFPRAQQFFGFLKKLGYRCSLDHFGAGLASLQHLRLLCPDFLKIDSSLIQGLEAHGFQHDLIEAIVHLAHSLGSHTVAGGVDEEKTLDLLRRLGVDLAQGLLLGLPQPLNKIFA